VAFEASCMCYLVNDLDDVTACMYVLAIPLIDFYLLSLVKLYHFFIVFFCFVRIKIIIISEMVVTNANSARTYET